LRAIFPAAKKENTPAFPMRAKTRLLSLLLLLAACLLPQVAFPRASTPAADAAAPALPAPEPRQPLFLLIAETQQGPVLLAVGFTDGSGVNWYAYPSDPVNYADLNGLWGIQIGGVKLAIGDVTLAFDRGSAGDLGHSAKVTVVGAGRSLKEAGYGIVDAGGMIMETALRKASADVRIGDFGSGAKALSRGDVELGSYYKANVLNLATAGTYGQMEATVEWSYGNISDDEFTERVGGTGVVQLGSAGFMKIAPGRMPTFAKWGNAVSNKVGAKLGGTAVGETLSEVGQLLRTDLENLSFDFVDEAFNFKLITCDEVVLHEMYSGHKWSPIDPEFLDPPIYQEGPFTDAQRSGFLSGNSGGTKIAPHHRHQLSVGHHGGMIDEIPGPGHPQGNLHTKLVFGENRHPGPSYFNKISGGKALRISEIFNHWIEKGLRLVPDPENPGMWIDPGPTN
jgi:hypothetical protein